MNPEEFKELVQLRLDQARTALEDARFLFDGDRSPQSIINRSYYAMFYATLALLQGISKTPSKHAGVISLFDTEFVLKGMFSKELSKDFHRAFELRHTADYKVSAPITRRAAENVWDKARGFVDALSAYLGKKDETTL